MTDTHCHLYMEDYGAERYDVVNRAIASGVCRMVFPNVDVASIEPMRELHDVYAFNTAMTMGLHPTELENVSEEGDPTAVLDEMERMLDSGEYAGIGEVGIDLHWEGNPCIGKQQEAFERQLRWGAERRLPVIIHSRDALEETLESIARVKESLPEGMEMPELIFHSFTGDRADVRRIREVCDPYFGINGVVTFKNAPGLRDALEEIGTEKLLLETDSPWLAPVPHRGQRNESSFIPHILETCAGTLGIPPGELERITDTTAERLFFNETY